MALFIETPGSANLQPRIEGAEKAIRASGAAITIPHRGDRRRTAGRAEIEAFWPGHSSYKGLFAVDGGSTEALARRSRNTG